MKKIILVLALSLGVAVSAQKEASKEAKSAKASVAALARATAKTPDLDWLEVGNVSEKVGMKMFRNAVNKAKKENKLIVTFFTSSVWCAPCRKIHKELLHNEEFKSVVKDDFIFIKGDLLKNPVKKAPVILKKLMRMFNKNQAVPCFSIIDNNGKVVKKIEAYNKPAVYIKEFKEVIAKHKSGE